MIDFSGLIVGSQYDRPYLAKIWGYQSFNAISRGVFTPANQNIIVLFVTREKQQALTQYEDHVEQDTLFWEGEKGHGSDKRIIEKKDTIHVFFREKHHSDFIYEGRAVLQRFHLFSDRPSKFSFTLIDRAVSEFDIVAEISQQYVTDKTEKDAIISARLGQGYYRQESIKLWKQCCVTGFSKPNILIASHIKPWKNSDNSERMNPYNSLLLVPTLDKLFDRGYIGFGPDGKIQISQKISEDDCSRIHLTPELRIYSVPEKTKPFLEYHKEYVFDMMET